MRAQSREKETAIVVGEDELLEIAWWVLKAERERESRVLKREGVGGRREKGPRGCRS